MKRFTAGLLHRSKSHDNSNNNNNGSPPIDSPEANITQAIRLFCESGSENTNNGEEVLHLPVIVESAEASAQAAAAAAHQIRKYLSKDNAARAYVQYNAIMLIRILADNPGETFTRNVDVKFVNTVKDLLKSGRDPSVQQILRETLDHLEADKAYDEGLSQLNSMWRAEKGRGSRIAPSVGRPPNFHVPPYNPNQPPVAPSQQEPNQRVFGRNQLPPPHELASRVEEAKNTAKILLQLTQSTPPEEVIGNDLLKEFADRCQSAQRSVQEFINCDSPPPDDDTLQTLIEVNEQLSLALSRHQRAVLSARRATGRASASPNPAQNSPFPPPPESQYQQQYQQPTSLFAPSRNDRQGGLATSDNGVSPVSPVSHETFDAPPGPPPPKVHLSHPEASHNDPFADHDDTYSSSGPSQEPGQNYYGNSAPLSAVPQNLARPGPGNAYYQGPTPSYLGRQLSAADGLTMHGGVDEPAPSSHDAYAGQGNNHGSVGGDVSPVETRPTYRY